MAETTNGAQEIFGNFCECTARCSSSRHKFPFKNFLTSFFFLIIYLAFCWKYVKVYLYFEKGKKNKKKWGFKKVVHKNSKAKN